MGKERIKMKARNINQEQFQQLISGDRPVLVDFWAPWCTYCRRIEEAYDAVAGQYAGQIDVVKVNIDDFEALAAQEGIELIPTLKLYQSGKALASIVAPESKTAIERFLGEQETRQQAPAHIYDMIIIGGGPGGYTAALYAVRAGLDAVVLEKLSAGGQMALTHQIDNYPGFVEGVEGYELSQRMQEQAHRFGARTENAEVLSVDLRADPKRIETSEGTYCGRTVVLAMGATPRKLGLKDEDALIGRGVAYCAACDGMFYRGKTVAVVGGGNSAAADALLLSRVAKEVILVHRRDELRAAKAEREPLMKAENVRFLLNSVVEELLYEDKLTGIRLRNVKTGEESVVACDGVFVSIGREPASQLVAGQLELSEDGYLLAGEDTQTSLPGVYAVGDVRTKPMRQVVTAVADGAVAVHMAESYLAGK